jgi:hypothetical protein
MTTKNYLQDWKPEADICIIIDDKTGEDRTQEEINSLFYDLRAAANKHGFDLNSWGSKESTIRFLSIIINADGTYKDPIHDNPHKQR